MLEQAASRGRGEPIKTEVAPDVPRCCEPLRGAFTGPTIVPDGPLSAWLYAHCQPYLQAALDRDIGTHDLDDVWAMIRAGTAQLWVTPNSATVSVMETFPRKRMLMVWLSGGRLEEILQVEADIRTWAKAQSCDLVCVTGRRGWLRALTGYREASTAMVRAL
ncbi:hypothetical protein [Methylobacterium sp. A54F]